MLSVDPEAVVFDDVPRGCTSEPADVVLSNAAATPVEDFLTLPVDFHLGVIPGAGAEIRVSYTADAPCQ